MKKDLSVLTDEVKSLIQTWLDIGDYTKCPFEMSRRKLNCPAICRALFPLLQNYVFIDGIADACPCDTYSTKYVIRMAKEFVK